MLDEMLPADEVAEAFLALIDWAETYLLSISVLIQVGLIMAALVPAAIFGPRLKRLIREQLSSRATTVLLRRLSEALAPSPAPDNEDEPQQEEIELQVKFKGYIDRQIEQVERFKKIESVLLPDDISYRGMSGLSNEVVEKLTKIKPVSLGQASRISGITPAAISVLQVHLRKMKKL